MQSFMDAGLSDDEFDVDDLAAGPSDAGAYAAGSAEHYPGGGPAHAGPSNVESIPAGDARASCAPAHDAAHGLASGCAVARPIHAKIVAVAVRQSGPRTRSSWCNSLVTHSWKVRFEWCFDWAVLTSALRLRDWALRRGCVVRLSAAGPARTANALRAWYPTCTLF